MRNIFILLFVVSLSPHALSQNSPFFFSGKILDAVTKLPLKNVSITINGTLSGTLSDSTGAFYLQASGSTVVLNFSMLGYEKKTLSVNAGSKDKLTVELSAKTSQLPEVSISASAIETVSKGKRYNVLDYDFYNGDVLMVTYVDPDKAKLVLLDQKNDTLGFRKIPGEPNRLFKDCLGNIHVVCKDSIYQAFYNGNTLSLLPAKSIRDFEKILLPCVAQDSTNLYLVEKFGGGEKIDVGIGAPVRRNDLVLSYVSIDKKKRKRTRFIVIADEHKMIMSNDEVAFEARKEEAGLKTLGDRLFAEKFLFTEVYAPLFEIRNSIYIFDYVNGNIKSFDKGLQLKRELPISYHKSLRFQEEMQVDEVSRKIFALFETDGMTEFKEINVNTGEISASYTIPYGLVTKAKVYNDYIYFIRKESNYDGVRYLSRMRIH